MRCIHFGFAVGPINCARVFVTLWALEFDGARLYVLGKQTERQLRPLQQRRILGGADQRASRDALGNHFRKGDTTCVAFIIFCWGVQLRTPPPPTAGHSATKKRVADMPVRRLGRASGGAGKRCTVRRYSETFGAVE